MSTASIPAKERELLAEARGGGQNAFGRIAEAHRAELHAHCYRMLGSVHDAEDAVQETFVRAWRGLGAFRGGSSLRTWLYRIATNVCLDALARRPKRVLPVDHGPATAPGEDFGPPLVESIWLEPYPDETLDIAGGEAVPHARYEQREALELAFVAALQHLPATQRAVLIMRDVLGFSAREAAELLENTVASVNSALQRARKTVEERLPERSQQETLRLQGDERMRALVDAYVDAWQRGDVAAVAALLAEDATFSMPPWPIWWRGRHAIAGFAATAAQVCPDVRTVRTSANGQLALVYYSLEAATGRYVASAIDVFTFDAGLIKDITAFVTPAMFPSFDLPAEYPVRAHAGS